MRKFVLFAANLSAWVAMPLRSADRIEIPDWAYPVNPAVSAVAVPDDGTLKHVPGSVRAFSRKQLSDIGGRVSDWRPDEHPAMPTIVSDGRPPQVYACAYCHLSNGAGRPENTSLAGLTVTYIKQQMAAFKNGDRPGSEPHRSPQTGMIGLAKAATDAEVDEAAAYFASLKPASFIKVIEATTVPKTVVAAWTLRRVPDGENEPLGRRIMEMPEDFSRFENRDSRTPYLVYVPVGSVKRGSELIAFGEKATQCVTCHGAELRGMADVPRLAGRSPSYLVRQLYDMKRGTRKGPATELMRSVVAKLTDDDILALTAYLASRAP